MQVLDETPHGQGKLGSTSVSIAGVFAFTSTFISLFAIWLHLKNYRRPLLQRFVVRILCMTPVYALISWLSLVSKNASFYLDIVRDVYEAFVIYSFFNLLVNYLGGERELLTMLHGRPPTSHLWPVKLWKKDMDVGDPYTFLFVKRGILQFVFVKPFLAVITIVLRATDSYQEGYISATSGYFWISFLYNISVSLCMYCLVIFFMTTKDDLEPYRPVPKFLCVKAVIAFSFWQGIFISFLVYIGVIRDKGEYTADNIGVAIQEWLICFEMVLAAVAHWYSFSHKDYLDETIQSARMPIYHAFRDAFGLRDVWEDSLDTLTGNRFTYRTFEPAEGFVASQGPARDARIAAGLRYADGGNVKYWLPQPPPRRSGLGRPRIPDIAGYAPLESGIIQDASGSSRAEPVDFPDVNEEEDVEDVYRKSRDLVHGDYNYPNIDPKIPRKESRRKRNIRTGRARNPPRLVEIPQQESSSPRNPYPPFSDSRDTPSSSSRSSPNPISPSDAPASGKTETPESLLSPLRRQMLPRSVLVEFNHGRVGTVTSTTTTIEQDTRSPTTSSEIPPEIRTSIDSQVESERRNAPSVLQNSLFQLGDELDPVDGNPRWGEP